MVCLRCQEKKGRKFLKLCYVSSELLPKRYCYATRHQDTCKYGKYLQVIGYCGVESQFCSGMKCTMLVLKKHKKKKRCRMEDVVQPFAKIGTQQQTAFFTFILQSRKNDGGALITRTNLRFILSLIAPKTF